MSQIEAALRALMVVSDTEYRWLGGLCAVDRPSALGGSSRATRAGLVRCLSRRLYDDFYTVGAPQSPVAPSVGRYRQRLAEALAVANRGRGCQASGWALVGVDGPRLVVERDGLRVRIWPRDARPAGGDGRLVPGSPVRVRLPKGNAASPGYYTAIGDHEFGAAAPGPTDRFYVHVGPTGAVELMRVATARLNLAGIAFRLKVVDDPDGYDRCDTAVLTVVRADRDRVRVEVAAICRALGDDLLSTIPALTLRLGPGLAFAEDPGGGRSFGAHRCDLLAEACVRAHEVGAVAIADRLQVARHCFDEAGVPFARPYLGPSLSHEAVHHVEELVSCP